MVLVDAGFSDGISMTILSGMTVIQLAAMALVVRLVDRVGRRPLALGGIGLMILGLCILILAFSEMGSASWAPLVAVFGMLVYRASFSLSLGPLPYIMTSEFFPQEARATGVAVSWTTNWACNFCVSQLFPILRV